MVDTKMNEVHDGNQAGPLELFNVTLDWEQGDDEQGDYATATWALDEDDAIRQVAEEMADSGEVHHETDADRTAYIQRVIAGAGPYAAERVIDTIRSDLGNLLAERPDALAAIKAILDSTTPAHGSATVAESASNTAPHASTDGAVHLNTAIGSADAPQSEFRPATLYVEAFASHEYPNARWARIELSSAFVSHIHGLRERCKAQGLADVREFGSPQTWSGEAQWRPDAPHLRVSKDEFWFEAVPKNVDAVVQTQAVPIDAMLELLRQTQSGMHDSDQFKWIDGVLYCDEEDAESLADAVADYLDAVKSVPAPSSAEVVESPADIASTASGGGTDILNAAQKVVLENYSLGEFKHMLALTSDGELQTELALCGDGLLRFLIVGLSTKEDCLSLEEATDRISRAIQDLDELKLKLEDAQGN